MKHHRCEPSAPKLQKKKIATHLSPTMNQHYTPIEITNIGSNYIIINNFTKKLATIC